MTGWFAVSSLQAELQHGTNNCLLACAGFQQQLSAVLNAEDVEHNIGEALMKLSGGRQPSRVICTGHSLGGALATLCAPWCAVEYPKADVRCITFGSPRVGAHNRPSAFCQFYDLT